MRRAPLRAKPPAKLSVPVMHKCRVCKTEFQQFRSFEVWCSPECGAVLALRAHEKKQAAQAKAQRALDREQRMALKPLHYWAKRAEKQFNRWVRLRDAGDGCISCGTYDALAWHAGHCYTVKARPDLRFHPDNVHLQCQQCNYHDGGNVQQYKLRLVGKIGQERMDALLRVAPAFKPTREYYQTIEATYKALADELEAA